MDLMTRYCCSYCDKRFHYKEFYDKHRIACEFFTQNRKQRLLQLECYEKLPTQDEMFQLLQHLTLKCQTLAEEVEKLKKSAFSIRKKNIDLFLDTLKPSMTFDDWIKLFEIDTKCITEIFNGNLTDGIIHCIRVRMDKNGTVIPIRAIKEKPGVIYIFEEDDETHLHKWNVCSNDKLSYMVDNIIHEVGKFYCNWKIEQHNIDMDTELSYMAKISGLKSNKNKQLQEVKSWIISQYNNV